MAHRRSMAKLGAMPRRPRVLFPGAVYHVTARGDRQEPIFVDDADRHLLLSIVGDGMARFGVLAYAYCLMGNHYHFIVCTPQANLPPLMRHVNGVYTQAHNRRHGTVGHVFQGRFKAALVDTDAYLLQACRYVELNPVRAGLADEAPRWRWSSCRAVLGLAPPPRWLAVTTILERLLGRSPGSEADLRIARTAYAAWLAEGSGHAVHDVERVT